MLHDPVVLLGPPCLEPAWRQETSFFFSQLLYLLPASMRTQPDFFYCLLLDLVMPFLKIEMQGLAAQSHQLTLAGSHRRLLIFEAGLALLAGSSPTWRILLEILEKDCATYVPYQNL